MQALKDEPYLAILIICGIGFVIAVAAEYFDVILILFGGALVIFVTLILPIGLLILLARGLSKLGRR